ncbi:MAG: [FeFe] hydrogenase, group A [Kiritimatiellia bacterium]
MALAPRIGRRSALQLIAAGSAGTMFPLATLGAQKAGAKYSMTDIRVPMSPDNPAVAFDAAKCVQCGACKSVCERMISVNGFFDLAKTGEPICVHCGQCTTFCEGEALTNKPEWQAVKAAKAAGKIIVVSTSPSVRVGLAEEFGKEPGTFCEGEMIAALRALGADYVLDTCFAADLTIMEEASELIRRVTKKDRPLPQFTSCCPAWVKFCETYYPELLPNVSTAKSPIGMQGPTIKTYFAQRRGIDPSKIYNVALTPCTAKKFEIRRPEMNASGYRDMDAVITTRELAQWMRAEKVAYDQLKPSHYDKLMGEASGAGVIFGNTGGVMEAALRTAYWMLNKKAPPEDLFKYTPVRGLGLVKKGKKTKKTIAKKATIELTPGLSATVIVVHGLANVRKVIEQIKEGTVEPTFIEVMACEGGCIGGGGQPRAKNAPFISAQVRQARIDALYASDARRTLRLSHENEEIKALYRDFYGAPLSEKAEKMLHTSYASRAKDLG